MAIVGYWRLNGNSNDASGNGYHGTDTSIDYAKEAGFLGQAAEFNSATDYINFPDIDTNYVTISHWLKIDSIKNINYYPMSINKDGYGRTGDTTRGWGFFFYIPVAGTKYSYWFVINNSDSSVNVTAEYANHTNIHMITGTFDGSYAKLFLDGVKKAELSLSGTLKQNNATVRMLIRGIDAAGEAIYGHSNNVFMCNNALPEAAIKNEYAKIKGFF